MRKKFIDKNRIPAVYRRIAPTYDLWARLTETKARDICLEWAAIRNGESVLEIAVGTGQAFEKIVSANPDGRNEGIDITEPMLQRARQRMASHPNANYRLAIGDAFDLKFADARFDVIVNNYMFDLLPEADFAAVLAQFKRVLRPGGRLAMVNMTVGEKWRHRLWHGVYRIHPALLGGCRGVRLLPWLEDAGFLRLRRQYVSQFGFPSEIVFGEKGLA
jgi:ubiquinone/menaquinone biosynthesis C-methylase UbiE